MERHCLIRDKKEIGKTLKAIRESKGMAVYRVARIGGIRSDQVTAIEAGESNYTIDSLMGYLKGVDCDISIETQPML